MNLVLLSFLPAPLVSVAKHSTVVSPCTDLQPLQEKWNKKKNNFASLLGKHFQRPFFHLAQSSFFTFLRPQDFKGHELLFIASFDCS